MDYITELYCLVDDFWQSVKEQIDNYMISDDKKHRNRQSILSLSEMTTLVILFHSMRFRQFKKFYQYVNTLMRREFPRLPSYNQFIELIPQCNVLLTVLFDSLKGSCTGVSVVDSTPLAVCDNLRISRHKVTTSFSTEDPLIDITFITTYTGMTDKWFYKLIQEGLFPKPIKPGRSSRWHKSEVECWLQQRIADSRGE